MAGIKLVAGLGNPGKEYAKSRHNTGFRVIDLLAEALQTDLKKRKFSARFGFGEYADKKLILFKPWQFMNRSGQSIATAMGFYKLSLGDLFVISDDMWLEPGRIRIRAKGSAGGQKGLVDIVEKLGTDEFGRLRVGIGQNVDVEATDYVLGRPTNEERLLIDAAIEKSRDAVLCWVEFGIETAMNRFNE
ncbi:MAG: aminoacyl-tRNA hydrolase [Planctomycetota bacterium]|jgi:PTH1 family peptidyl-tRNA hydrolase